MQASTLKKGQLDFAATCRAKRIKITNNLFDSLLVDGTENCYLKLFEKTAVTVDRKSTAVDRTSSICRF